MLTGMVLGLLIVVPLALAIGAVILRAAVAWYNRMAGNSPQRAIQPGYSPNTGYSPNVAGRADSGNPFASPTAYGSLPVEQSAGVPEPSYGKAMGIVFVAGFAGNVFGWIWNAIGAGIVGNSFGALMGFSLLSLPINFCISAAILKAMLPTQRFGSACLITLLQLVIVLLIALVLSAIFGAVYFGAMK